VQGASGVISRYVPFLNLRLDRPIRQKFALLTAVRANRLPTPPVKRSDRPDQRMQRRWLLGRRLVGFGGSDEREPMGASQRHQAICDRSGQFLGRTRGAHGHVSARLERKFTNVRANASANSSHPIVSRRASLYRPRRT
jgi:hypothetical protein